MTAAEVRAELRRAAGAAWPGAARASDLPFPSYWKAAAEWLEFHAPRVGDALMRRFVSDVVEEAQSAEREGRAPAERRVPCHVRAIWREIEARMAEDGPPSGGQPPQDPPRGPRLQSHGLPDGGTFSGEADAAGRPRAASLPGLSAGGRLED